MYVCMYVCMLKGSVTWIVHLCLLKPCHSNFTYFQNILKHQEWTTGQFLKEEEIIVCMFP